VLIDSHCHLDFPEFDEDREEVLARATANGVRYIVNPGIDLATSQRAVMLASRYAEVYAMVGIHPYHAATVDEATLTELRGLAKQPKVVAIGEIGLDYYRGSAPPAVQIEALWRQLMLAAELGKPVAIHQREAGADLRRVLSKWVAELQPDPYCERMRGVLHAFSGDLELAEEGHWWRFFLGLGGSLTFPNASSVQRVAKELPLTQVVVETDAPYLSPYPYRGQRNEPGRVVFVAEALARLHNVPMAEVARQTTQNANHLFGIEQWAEP
jgi:TatD DNase family protein